MPASREFYLFNSTIAGIEEADAILLVGCNPRREAPVLNARIRKRWLQGGCPIGLDRRAGGPDLRRPASRRRARARCTSSATSARCCRTAKRPMIIVGQGALRRPDGAAVLAAAWALATARGAISAGVARLQRAAHRGGPGRRARPRLRAGAGRQGAARRCWAAASTCSGCSAPTSSTPAAIGPRHLRRLPGPSRRPRRGPRRRDPAGRGLHREERHLGQHRGPGAARLPGGAAAGRGARGLGDPARVQRRDRQAAAV